MAYHRSTPHSALSTGVLGDTFDRIGVGQIGAPVPDEELVASIGGVWAVPDAHGDVLREYRDLQPVLVRLRRRADRVHPAHRRR